MSLKFVVQSAALTLLGCRLAGSAGISTAVVHVFIRRKPKMSNRKPLTRPQRELREGLQGNRYKVIECRLCHRECGISPKWSLVAGFAVYCLECVDLVTSK